MTKGEMLEIEKRELKKAKEARDDRWTDINYQLSMTANTYILSRHSTQSYGAKIPKLIMFHSLGRLAHVSPKINKGDTKMIGVDDSFIFYEMKTSYSNKDDLHNFTHIRIEDDFQFFMIALYDSLDDYRGRYYVIEKTEITEGVFKLHAMNGTIERNKKNGIIEMRFTLPKNETYKIFDKLNILDGNSFEDLLDYMYCFPIIEKKKTKKTHVVNPMAKATRKMYVEGVSKLHRKSKTHFVISYDGQFFHERTNVETIVSLISYMGPKLASKVVPDFMMSKTRLESHTEILRMDNGDEFFFNPRMSFRDIQRFTKRARDKFGIDIDIQEQ